VCIQVIIYLIDTLDSGFQIILELLSQVDCTFLHVNDILSFKAWYGEGLLRYRIGMRE
jgi:hypothetical protein